MTLSDIMIQHPLQTMAWAGILSLLFEGLLVGFIRCCREDRD